MSIGTSPYRVDAPGKVTGAALFPGDLTRERLLHAKVLFSNQPHARMLRMDTSAAEAVPGVVAIFTAVDVPVNEYGLTMFDQPVLVGVNASGRSPVPSNVSRWEGDQVAIIVAETEAAAAEARERIEIEWEPLPLLPDMDTAVRDEILLHPEHPAQSNIYHHYKIRKGDMAAGWAAADVIIEGEYHLPNQEHAYLQPEAALSYVDEQGRVTVEVAGQWTHEDQAQIAHALELPPEQVRIIYPAIGGAFGGREDMSLQIVMALASWKLHQRGETRPIRCIWSREESIIGHHKRHRGRAKTRWGATKDGKITAVEAEVFMDAGAYNYTTNKVMGNFHLTVGGPYEIPNAHIDSYAVYTNSVPGGAFRGFGAPQGCFVAEAQMNKLAKALNMDPVELRLKNCYHEDSIGITQTPLPAGVSLPQVIEACADAANWPTPITDHRLPITPFQSLPPDPTTLRFGRGFACAYKNIGYSFGFPERCEATIELYGAGNIERVVLKHAAAEVGQGTHTALRQMAATAVGVPLEMVELVMSDTAVTGDSGSVSASRMTWMAGNAIQLAAAAAKQEWTDEDRPAIGHARFTPPATEPLHPETGHATPNFAYGYVAECVDLAVDVETGHIHLLRVVCADDVGKAINPRLIEGQIEGGVVQALGYAVTEELVVKDGRVLNPRFSTYLIPGVRDIPDAVESVILEIPDPRGPWGVRGMAEMPFIPLAAAIAAALHDATGVWFNEIPLTPVKVAARLREQLKKEEE
ncbi:MAG TPA: xanthine dehydrogenase family protein molybdopterin-binding subunit [Chloroflexota bacterium]|nr:xanthine dehydrogenase family protein molybdopterin-binding subunit [Chloroflexota bacterium]